MRGMGYFYLIVGFVPRPSADALYSDEAILHHPALSHHGIPKMVVIFALMRKVLSIAQVVLKSQRPFDAALHKN